MYVKILFRYLHLLYTVLHIFVGFCLCQEIIQQLLSLSQSFKEQGSHFSFTREMSPTRHVGIIVVNHLFPYLVAIFYSPQHGFTTPPHRSSYGLYTCHYKAWSLYHTMLINCPGKGHNFILGWIYDSFHKI